MKDIKTNYSLKSVTITSVDKNYRNITVEKRINLINYYNDTVSHYAWLLPNVKYDLEIAHDSVVRYAISNCEFLIEYDGYSKINIMEDLIKYHEDNNRSAQLIQIFLDDCSCKWMSTYVMTLINSDFLDSQSLALRFMTFFYSYFFVYYDYHSDHFCAEFVEKFNRAFDILGGREEFKRIIINIRKFRLLNDVKRQLNAGSTYFTIDYREMIKYSYDEFLVNVQILNNLKAMGLITFVDSKSGLLNVKKEIKLDHGMEREKGKVSFVINQLLQKELNVVEMLDDLRSDETSLTGVIKARRVANAIKNQIKKNDPNLKLSEGEFRSIVFSQRTNLYVLCCDDKTQLNFMLASIAASVDRGHFASIKGAAMVGEAVDELNDLSSVQSKMLFRLLNVNAGEYRNILNAWQKRSSIGPISDIDVLLLNEVNSVDLDGFNCIARYIPNLKRLIMFGDYRLLPANSLGNVLQDIHNSQRFGAGVTNELINPQNGDEIYRFIKAFDEKRLTEKDIMETKRQAIDIIDVMDNKRGIDETCLIFTERLKIIKDVLFGNDDILVDGEGTVVDKRDREIDKSELYAHLCDLQAIYPFVKASVNHAGINTINRLLRETYFITMFGIDADETGYCQYDKVIFTASDDRYGCVVNQLGMVIDNDGVNIEIMVKNDRIITLPLEHQSLIALAYCLPVNKMQGMTAREVIYLFDEPGYGVNAKDQIYTGMTRATTHLYLVGNIEKLLSAQFTLKNERFTYFALMLDQPESAIYKIRHMLFKNNAKIKRLIETAFK